MRRMLLFGGAWSCIAVGLALLGVSASASPLTLDLGSRQGVAASARPPGRDKTPPVFAGLQSAETCIPGPQRPGETSAYHLAWKAAHDNVTPRSQIVYDIFMSTAPGDEDFSHPNWTTGPGATRFTTPRLPSNGSVYFVVRARDRAGNEDHNNVERRGVNPCV